MPELIPVTQPALYQHCGYIKIDNRGAPSMSVIIDHRTVEGDDLVQRDARVVSVPFDADDADMQAAYAALQAIALRAIGGEFDAPAVVEELGDAKP